MIQFRISGLEAILLTPLSSEPFRVNPSSIAV